MSETASGFIGVDIGGTNLRGALIGADGEIVHRFRTQSLIHEGVAPFLERLCEGIGGLRAAAQSDNLSVEAVGVGVPGLLDRSGVVRSSVNMPPLQGIPLQDILASRLKLPVRCANDANLIALGEWRYGAGQGLDSLLMLTIGTGLGSGLILRGGLWEGSRGFAAECGHLTVVPDGHPCPCGNRGCLEQYVSATALTRKGGGVPPDELARLARGGNHQAQLLFEDLGRYLGIALAGLLNVLNLDGVLIGGGVAVSYDLFASSLSQELHRRAFPQVLTDLVLCTGMLGDDAGLLGGALLAASGK